MYTLDKLLKADTNNKRTITDLTWVDVKQLDKTELEICVMALVSAYRLLDWDRAREKRDHAMTRYSYAALQLDGATAELKITDLRNRGESS